MFIVASRSPWPWLFSFCGTKQSCPPPPIDASHTYVAFLFLWTAAGGAAEALLRAGPVLLCVQHEGDQGRRTGSFLLRVGMAGDGVVQGRRGGRKWQVCVWLYAGSLSLCLLANYGG